MAISSIRILPCRAISSSKLFHLSCNLCQSSLSNPNGFIFSGTKLHIANKGIVIVGFKLHILSLYKDLLSEFYPIDREFTDEIKFFLRNIRVDRQTEIEIICEFSNAQSTI